MLPKNYSCALSESFTAVIRCIFGPSRAQVFCEHLLEAGGMGVRLLQTCSVPAPAGTGVPGLKHYLSAV